MTTNIGMQGRYRMVAYKLDGTERVLADWFENLILDNGLNGIESSGSMLSSCFVGSGTAAPAVGQTQLSNLVASTNNLQSILNGNELASGYAWRRFRYRFAQGAAAGNLSEVGVGLTSSSLFSRARILDGSGTPTTITVLPDEFLDITYEVRAYWPTTDQTGTVSINGVSTNFVMRVAYAGSWGASWLTSSFGSGAGWNGQCFAAGTTLGTIDQFPNGSSIGSSDSALRVGAYVNNSFSRTFRLTFGLNGVTEPIGAMLLFSGGVSDMYFQCSFNPPIPKTSSNNFNGDFTLTWARRSI